VTSKSIDGTLPSEASVFAALEAEATPIVVWVGSLEAAELDAEEVLPPPHPTSANVAASEQARAPAEPASAAPGESLHEALCDDRVLGMASNMADGRINRKQIEILSLTRS